ncbi:hypothetical protein STANM309S_03702 [Streptomyces tanashiensis]
MPSVKMPPGPRSRYPYFVVPCLASYRSIVSRTDRGNGNCRNSPPCGALSFAGFSVLEWICSRTRYTSCATTLLTFAAGLAVAQTTAGRHDDLQCEVLIGYGQCLRSVTERGNGDRSPHVFRFLDSLHRVVRRGPFGVRVAQDGLEGPEDVHLVSSADPAVSISSRNRSTTIGVTEFSFRDPRRGTMCTLIELSTCQPVEQSVKLRCRGRHCFEYSSTVCWPSSRRAAATEGAVVFFSA